MDDVGGIHQNEVAEALIEMASSPVGTRGKFMQQVRAGVAQCRRHTRCIRSDKHPGHCKLREQFSQGQGAFSGISEDDPSTMLHDASDEGAKVVGGSVSAGSEFYEKAMGMQNTGLRPDGNTVFLQYDQGIRQGKVAEGRIGGDFQPPVGSSRLDLHVTLSSDAEAWLVPNPTEPHLREVLCRYPVPLSQPMPLNRPLGVYNEVIERVHGITGFYFNFYDSRSRDEGAELALFPYVHGLPAPIRDELQIAIKSSSEFSCTGHNLDTLVYKKNLQAPVVLARWVAKKSMAVDRNVFVFGVLEEKRLFYQKWRPSLRSADGGKAVIRFRNLHSGRRKGLSEWWCGMLAEEDRRMDHADSSPPRDSQTMLAQNPSDNLGRKNIHAVDFGTSELSSSPVQFFDSGTIARMGTIHPSGGQGTGITSNSFGFARGNVLSPTPLNGSPSISAQVIPGVPPAAAAAAAAAAAQFVTGCSGSPFGMMAGFPGSFSGMSPLPGMSPVNSMSHFMMGTLPAVQGSFGSPMLNSPGHWPTLSINQAHLSHGGGTHGSLFNSDPVSIQNSEGLGMPKSEKPNTEPHVRVVGFDQAVIESRGPHT